MRVPKKIRDEIKKFCELNDIDDIDKFIIKNIETGFNIEKYGNAPFVQEVIVEKEVVKEVVKEIPVEVEVVKVEEKIIEKEVPVEKEVIKEVILEKEVYATDDICRAPAKKKNLL